MMKKTIAIVVWCVMIPTLFWAQPPRIFDSCEECSRYSYQSAISVSTGFPQPDLLTITTTPNTNTFWITPIDNEYSQKCKCEDSKLYLQFKPVACTPTSILINQIPASSLLWDPVNSVLTIESLDFDQANFLQIQFDCSTSASSPPKQIALEKATKGGLCMILNVEKSGELTGVSPATQWCAKFLPPQNPKPINGWGWKNHPGFGLSHTGFFATHWGWQTQIGYQTQFLAYELPADLITYFGDTLTDQFDQARWHQIQLATGPVAQYTLQKWRGQVSLLAGIQTQKGNTESITLTVPPGPAGPSDPISLVEFPSHSFRGTLQPGIRVERLLSKNWSIWLGANYTGYLSTPAAIALRNPNKALKPGGRFDFGTFQETALKDFTLEDTKWTAQLGICFQFVPKKLQNPCGNN